MVLVCIYLLYLGRSSGLLSIADIYFKKNAERSGVQSDLFLLLNGK